MAEREAIPGEGNIEIELDGVRAVLMPSAGACFTISRIGGGLTAAVQRCLQLDVDTICAVIAAGMGLNPNQARGLPDKVYATGAMQLSGPCIDFINVVGNGGRALPDEPEDGDQGDPLRPASL